MRGKVEIILILSSWREKKYGFADKKYLFLKKEMNDVEIRASQLDSLDAEADRVGS